MCLLYLFNTVPLHLLKNATHVYGNSRLALNLTLINQSPAQYFSARWYTIIIEIVLKFDRRLGSSTPENPHQLNLRHQKLNDDVIKWKHSPVTGEFPSQRPVTRSPY